VYLEATRSGRGRESSVRRRATLRRCRRSRVSVPPETPFRGETVEFPNRDDTYHSVFSYSKTKRFDLGRYRKGEEPASIVFDKPGVVKLFCEIHEHMRATVLVLDTPYFAKTDGDGSFRIESVPPGRYRLTAWVEEERALVREIDVADRESGALEIDAR
jgi:hypothetical protein